MEHDLNILMIFCIKEKDHFDPCSVLLAIATNIPVLLMTGFVLQGHSCYNVVPLFTRLCCCTEDKSLSKLENPRESASAPALEAAVPEASHRSSVSSKSLTHTCLYPSVHTALMCDTLSLFSAQYRQVKRGSLGAVTMSQLMKRQLEHQSSAPQNISTWDTGQSYISTFLSHYPALPHYLSLNTRLHKNPPLRFS